MSRKRKSKASSNTLRISARDRREFEQARQLQSRLKKILLASGESEFVAAETAFHMTDWLADLKAISALFLGEARWAKKAVTRALGMFLVHAPNHVAAAAKIYSDYPVADIFEVGAIEGSKPRHTARNPLYPLG